MICPFCGATLPKITAASTQTAANARSKIRPHQRHHGADDESPYALVGTWVLDPVRRVRVWQPA